MSTSTADGVACEPCTASENAVTSVASRSTVTSPPPVHGVAPPAPEVGVGGAVAPAAPNTKATPARVQEKINSAISP